MKISEYPKVEAVASTDVLLVDGENGTKTIEAGKLAKSTDSLAQGAAVSKDTPVGTDEVPVYDAAGRKKITFAKFLAGIQSGLNGVFAPKTHSHSAADVGAVPTTRKVNNKPLSADVTLNAGDVGALPAGGTAAAATKLAAQRTIQVDLGREDALSFDGTASITPGVKGILPAAHGGIGTAGEAHRMIFRGKNLGSAVTAAQKTAIQNGTFTDLFLGDYWEIGGVKWRIADFDYYLYCGGWDDDADIISKHHLVVVPDRSLYTHKMEATNITTNGYKGTLMRTSGLSQAKTTINAAFGTLVMNHEELLVYTCENGVPSDYEVAYCTVELMSETMVYGSFMEGIRNTNSVRKYDKQQFALFAVAPKFIVAADPTDPTNRDWYWLRDVVSATSFAYVISRGAPNYVSASGACGVRPYFLLG